MKYLIADISRISKPITKKTFEQKILDVLLDKTLKTTREKMFLIKQIIRGEELRNLAKNNNQGSI